MVCEWGMSDNLGPLTFGNKEEQVFLGRDFSQQSDYSEETAMGIDQEIKRIVTCNYDRAREVLEAHRSELNQIAEELLVREVLDAGQVMRLARGEALTESVVIHGSLQHPPDVHADDPEDERPQGISPVPSFDKAVT
jgi:cell division protease FtsH